MAEGVIGDFSFLGSEAQTGFELMLSAVLLFRPLSAWKAGIGYQAWPEELDLS